MDYQIELVHLKEDVFKELKKLDKKFTDLHNEKSANISQDILTPLDKINIMMNKTEQMFNAVTDQQIKIDKITELETFKSKANDVILSHEIRIKSLIKDLEDMKFKYDREISQNLTVPGFIGISSRFKTLSEFLLHNIDEMAKLKMEKDLIKKEEKELKARIDSILKNILNVVDNSVNRANLYTDNKQKHFEELLNNKYKEFNEKIMEMKTQTITNEKSFKEELNRVTKLSNELTYLKANVESVMDKKNNEMKSFINDLKNKVYKNNNEIKKNPKNLDKINNKINGFINNINFESKNKLNQSKKISLLRKSDNNNINHNYGNNNYSENNHTDRNYIKENTNLNNQKIIDSFKGKKSNEINVSGSQRKVEKISSDEYFKNFDNLKKEYNGKQNNRINKNNIKTYNDLKYNKKPNLLLDKENKYNDNIESYSIEGKTSSERKTINLDVKSNRETNKQSKIEFNNKINLSDGENEKKILKLNRKKNNIKNNKIDKFTLIKIDKNKTVEKFNKENVENNIINHTGYNFYHKRDLNNFHYYKNEINNLKRLRLHKIYKEENSEENSRRANSDMNLDINLDDISPNQIQSPKKVNNIYYPNKEIIKNLKHKNFILNQFLIRRNTSYNNKSDTRYSKIFLYDNNNQMNETINYTYNRSNTLDKVISPPPLKNDCTLNKKDGETQSNIKNKDNKIPEKLNFKYISLDNQFQLALNKKKIRFRNNPELLLSVPITNVLRTFQSKRNKKIVNNKIYLNFGQSFSNKIEEKKINIIH